MRGIIVEALKQHKPVLPDGLAFNVACNYSARWDTPGCSKQALKNPTNMNLKVRFHLGFLKYRCLFYTGSMRTIISFLAQTLDNFGIFDYPSRPLLAQQANLEPNCFSAFKMEKPLW